MVITQAYIVSVVDFIIVDNDVLSHGRDDGACIAGVVEMIIPQRDVIGRYGCLTQFGKLYFSPGNVKVLNDQVASYHAKVVGVTFSPKPDLARISSADEDRLAGGTVSSPPG